MGSLMYDEALASAKIVATQQLETNDQLQMLGQLLSDKRVNVALTVARGSSDHAANYFAYLAMLRMGLPVVSLPMSLLTLHEAPLMVQNQIAVAFSQSGRSPDLVRAMEGLKQKGAHTLAFVNQEGSPLADVCEWSLPLCAGAEKSVAATKSYIATLAASARLIAHWKQDQNLLTALDELPDALLEASKQDWSMAIEALKDAQRVMVVGRGLGFSVALEAALKFKETCGIQAEAFSSAEIKHGPMALIEEGYPLLVFAPKGPEQAGLLALASEMRGRGAKVLLAAPQDVEDRELTIASSSDVALDPLLVIQSFYLMVAQLSEARGLNPDMPPHLSKITQTI